MSDEHHTPAANQIEAQYEPGTDQDLDAGTIWYTVIVGTIITILVIYLLKAMFYKADREEIMAKTYGVPYSELEELRAGQAGQLDGYEWLDSRFGRVTMPIDQAMELTVREYAAGRTDPPMPLAAAPVPAPQESSPSAAADNQAPPAPDSGEETAAQAGEAPAH